MDGSTLFETSGVVGEDALGNAVAGSGDVNQDGLADFLVGGRKADANGTNSGQALLFSGSCGAIQPHGSGCPGWLGFRPTFSLTGCAAPLGAVRINVSQGNGGVTALLVFGLQPASLPMSNGCTLNVAPLLPVALPLPLSGLGPGSGTFDLDLIIPAGTPLGTICMQVFIPEPNAPAGYSNTAGIELTIG
ncbi:MAG: FG-GAP repeat protein [Planctomycetes bacterium]|nr:FG-GAP repeat protein [Planctomycetota bacterium]